MSPTAAGWLSLAHRSGRPVAVGGAGVWRGCDDQDGDAEVAGQAGVAASGDRGDVGDVGQVAGDQGMDVVSPAQHLA
jgi:hypothetical protein